MSEPELTELRVLSFDVDGLRSGAESVADVIRQLRPDVVLVQGAPERLRWRSKRAALARQSALVVATAHRPGGLLVMTTLAVAVHGSSFRQLGAGSGVSSADVTLRGTRWRVASTNQSLGEALPAGMTGELRLVVGNGATIRAHGAVSVVSTDVVAESAVVAQLLAHG